MTIAARQYGRSRHCSVSTIPRDTSRRRAHLQGHLCGSSRRGALKDEVAVRSARHPCDIARIQRLRNLTSGLPLANRVGHTVKISCRQSNEVFLRDAPRPLTHFVPFSAASSFVFPSTVEYVKPDPSKLTPVWVQSVGVRRTRNICEVPSSGHPTFSFSMSTPRMNNPASFAWYASESQDYEPGKGACRSSAMQVCFMMKVTKSATCRALTRRNVFEALGHPDAADRQAKLRLAYALNQVLEGRQLSQADATRCWESRSRRSLHCDTTSWRASRLKG